MSKESCELCGNKSPGSITRCDIVPSEIVKEAGITRWKTVGLCPGCRRELDSWYSIHIHDMTYDTSIKRFRLKSPLLLVKEYEMAYQRFAENKKGQMSKLNPGLF